METSQKSLLVHYGALGDSVLALRLVSAMRAACGTPPTVLGRGEFRTIFELAGVEDVADVESSGIHAIFSDEAADTQALKTRLGDFETTVNMLAGGPNGLDGRRLAAVTRGRVIDIDPRPHEDWSGHITEQWMADLATAGLRACSEPTHLHIPEAAKAEGRRALVSHAGDSAASGEGKLAILHPGSGAVRKCWPPGDFVRLAEMLRRQGMSPVVLVGPVEIERWTPAEFPAFSAQARVMTSPSMSELPALLSAADLYVGNDSGVTHLAAAVGAPTVAIFGPTDPRRWRPLGEQVTVIAARSPHGWPSVDEAAAASLAAADRVRPC